MNKKAIVKKRDTVTKREILDKVQERSGVGLDVVCDVVDILLDEIMESVCKKKTVKIIGFGVWEPRLHTGLATRNPYINEAVETKPFIRPWHRCAEDFKKRVKEATEGK